VLSTMESERSEECPSCEAELTIVKYCWKLRL
jgi:hypothetical protein